MTVTVKDEKETITLPNKADFEKLLKEKKGWYCPVKIRGYLKKTMKKAKG
jgi:hypothetical protein